VEKWDSLQHVNLIMALEKEFGVTIDVDDAVSMISFPDVCRALARYLG
jgi:acyl carrier protein